MNRHNNIATIARARAVKADAYNDSVMELIDGSNKVHRIENRIRQRGHALAADRIREAGLLVASAMRLVGEDTESKGANS